jgi:renalase
MTHHPSATTPPRVAIIGAGISGLTLANNLSNCARITVFEKARGVGGRMSTRYADPFYFDHGTQFFTARTKPFQKFLAPMIESGLVAPWVGKVITIHEDRSIHDRLWFEPHYVAVPNMNSLCKAMAEGVPITLGTEVAPLQQKASDGWHLMDKAGKALGVYDWVISTAPPVQTQRLFATHLADDNPLPPTRLLGCYTLMLGWNRPWSKPWMAAKIHASPLEWIAVNSTKPGRNAAVTSLVVHSSNLWAEAHIDDDMNEAETFLRAEFESVSGIETQDADYVSCHRWRYALVEEPQASSPFIDTSMGLASSGDWCSASRIEDAWTNATNLAARIRALI